MFISVLLGALFGSFLGNTLVFYVIGIMAKRTEKQQREEAERLMGVYNEMIQNEKARMQKYAEMES